MLVVCEVVQNIVKEARDRNYFCIFALTGGRFAQMDNKGIFVPIVPDPSRHTTLCAVARQSQDCADVSFSGVARIANNFLMIGDSFQVLTLHVCVQSVTQN